MPKLTLCTGNITNFTGDALICPCDCALTNHYTSIAKLVLHKGGNDLVQGVTAIGFGEIGNALIVKGYKLGVKYVIFLPVKDQEMVIDQVTLHQALRNALTLAGLHKVRTLAVPMLNPKITSKVSIFNSLLGLNNRSNLEILTDDKVLDTITAVSRDFERSSLKEISIYRNTKPQNVSDLLATRGKKIAFG